LLRVAMHTVDEKQDDALRDEGKNCRNKQLWNAVLHEVREIRLPAVDDVLQEMFILRERIRELLCRCVEKGHMMMSS
jgi:hypothetical protein